MSYQTGLIVELRQIWLQSTQWAQPLVPVKDRDCFFILKEGPRLLISTEFNLRESC